MAVTVESLGRSLPNARIVGDRDLQIDDARPLHKAGPHDITFVADAANLRLLLSRDAGAVVISEELFETLDPSDYPMAMIIVEDAKSAFVDLLGELFTQPSRPNIGVSVLSTVNPTARVGPSTNIFPGAQVGEDVRIGAECDIHPNAFIGAGCRLGDRVVIHPGAVLYPGVEIGDRVIIHAAAVIGADGFGYRLVDGRHERIPHYGTVRIEDDVEIGACTTIDRAMIGETVVGAGTKLDNQVMIGHNCELGKHNIFVSQVALAGSVTTGDHVVCAGQVGVVDHVHLGTGCVVGSKAGVHKDIPAGQTYIGAPAQPAADAMKSAMALKKLPELRNQLKRLEAQVATLTEQLNNLSVRHATCPEAAA